MKKIHLFFLIVFLSSSNIVYSQVIGHYQSLINVILPDSIDALINGDVAHAFVESAHIRKIKEKIYEPDKNDELSVSKKRKWIFDAKGYILHSSENRKVWFWKKLYRVRYNHECKPVKYTEGRHYWIKENNSVGKIEITIKNSSRKLFRVYCFCRNADNIQVIFDPDSDQGIYVINTDTGQVFLSAAFYGTAGLDMPNFISVNKIFDCCGTKKYPYLNKDTVYSYTTFNDDSSVSKSYCTESMHLCRYLYIENHYGPDRLIIYSDIRKNPAQMTHAAQGIKLYYTDGKLTRAVVGESKWTAYTPSRDPYSYEVKYFNGLPSEVIFYDKDGILFKKHLSYSFYKPGHR